MQILLPGWGIGPIQKGAHTHLLCIHIPFTAQEPALRPSFLPFFKLGDENATRFTNILKGSYDGEQGESTQTLSQKECKPHGGTKAPQALFPIFSCQGYAVASLQALLNPRLASHPTAGASLLNI